MCHLHVAARTSDLTSVIEGTMFIDKALYTHHTYFHLQKLKLVLYFKASPIRIATCNLHGHLVKSGVTGVLPAVQVRQFVAAGSNVSVGNTSSSNTTGSGRSQHAASR
jgi:hypothetical protein